jgi:SPP1 family predicted phage head-tail adaptor
MNIANGASDMRAGKLDRVITIERYTYSGSDQHGSPIEDWVGVADMRAQIVQASTEEFVRNYGIVADEVVIFRIRHFSNLNTTDRISFAGHQYNIKQIVPIGRERGLELRCVRVST